MAFSLPLHQPLAIVPPFSPYLIPHHQSSYPHYPQHTNNNTVHSIGFLPDFPLNKSKNRNNGCAQIHIYRVSRHRMTVTSTVQNGRGPPKRSKSRNNNDPQAEKQTQKLLEPQNSNVSGLGNKREMQSTRTSNSRKSPKTTSQGLAHNFSADFDDVYNNKALHRLCRAGKLTEAFYVLEQMVGKSYIPDVHSCTNLIRGFCKGGRTERANRVLEIMVMSGCVPDVVTYNVLINGFCKKGEIERAMQLLDEMSASGCPPDVVTYNTVLRSLCSQGKLDQAVQVLNGQLQKGCPPDVVTYTILIEATCKESGVDSAMELLDEMVSKGCIPDVVTYNVIINGICREGRLDQAAKFLNDLPSKGCQPNVITHNIVLRGLCNAGRWEDAENLLSDMVQKGCAPSVVTYNILTCHDVKPIHQHQRPMDSNLFIIIKANI